MPLSEWKEYKFNDLGEIKTGKTPPNKAGDIWGNSIQFITPTDISNQKYITQTNRGLSDLGLEKVKTGRDLAEKAADALEQIIRSVTQVSDVIEQVAAANEEQSATAKHISESIVTINNVSRDNSNRVEQVTAAIEDLRKLTVGLEELIHKFEIGNQLGKENKK